MAPFAMFISRNPGNFVAMIAINFCLDGDSGLRYWSVEFIEHVFLPH